MFEYRILTDNSRLPSRVLSSTRPAIPNEAGISLYGMECPLVTKDASQARHEEIRHLLSHSLKS